jgi:hypothetical protein
MLVRRDISVHNLAQICYHAVTSVLDRVVPADRQGRMEPWSQNTGRVQRHVVENMGHATTIAIDSVMTEQTVGCANSAAMYVHPKHWENRLTWNRYNASIRAASFDATKRARPVSKPARGHVSIKALARCLVQLPATGYHVTNAVPSFFAVVTNVLVYAVKTVQLTTVNNAV